MRGFPVGADSGAVIGRERELATVEALLAGVREHGSALVIHGDAGIGKSTLLAAAAKSAADRGMVVLEVSGAQSEAHLPFAGLHQLLRPLLRQLPSLPRPQRLALEAAFGVTDAIAPDLFLIALAAVPLRSPAARSPNTHPEHRNRYRAGCGSPEV
jgi:predicted ATPase